MSAPGTIETNEVEFRPSNPPHPPGKQPKRRWWVWLLALAVVALGAYRVRKGMVAPQAANATAPGNAPGRNFGAVPVVAVQATKGDIGVYLTGLGSVVPIYTVTVKSQIPGYLTEVLYKEGQMVHKGDLLAQVDPRPYQVMLEQAEAGLARDQANLENAKVDLKRYQTLVPVHAVPEQQLATQEALVRQYEGTVKADQAQIDTAKLDLVYCHITAPITGRVGLRLVDPGNYVSPSDATGLVVITQIQPISVVFTLDEFQLPQVMERLRHGARLKVDACDRDMKEIAQGSLETVDNQIDPTTGTVKLRANFENRDGTLFPNEFINAKLLVQEKYNVTLIPTAAVQRNSQRTYVFLVKPDSTATVKTITIDTTEGDESQVTSGLAPGDYVVMTGVDRLQEGTKVRFQKTREQ